MAERPAASGTRRIVFAVRDVSAFVQLRGALLAEARRRRHGVLCLAPAFDSATRAVMERLGVLYDTVQFEPQGFNPLAGYHIRRDLAARLVAFGPHTLAFTDLTLAPVLAHAAQKATVGHLVAMVAEFAPHLVVDKPMRKAVERLSAAIVDTPEAARAARALSHAVHVIPSAGVNLTTTEATPLPPIGEGLTFLLVTAATDMRARETFAKAAATVKERSGLARFAQADGDDIAAIAAAHVIVHAATASGLSPGLLAGLGYGRPLITTDVAGARDAVDERVNGCRVAPEDPTALAAAMLSFLRRPHELASMARASRAKAERRFDVSIINAATLDVLGLGESYAAAA